jgi:hypothetical protein
MALPTISKASCAFELSEIELSEIFLHNHILVGAYNYAPRLEWLVAGWHGPSRLQRAYGDR